MQLTERHLIKPSHKLHQTLDDLTYKAKNLYNHGLYLYRQSYFEYKKDSEKPMLSWMDIDRNLRQQGHEDIRALPSKVANAVLKNLGEAISSYWKLVRLNCNGDSNQKPKLPHYLHKVKGALSGILQLSNLRENERFQSRVNSMPEKYLFAHTNQGRTPETGSYHS